MRSTAGAIRFASSTWSGANAAHGASFARLPIDGTYCPPRPRNPGVVPTRHPVRSQIGPTGADWATTPLDVLSDETQRSGRPGSTWTPRGGRVMREFDACGIGFVADAEGRPS